MSEDARAENSTTKRSQWRLSTLLSLMLGFAVLFGGIANIRSVVDMKMTFKSLPPNDDALVTWLKKTYRASRLSIKRPNEQTLTLQFSRVFYSLDVPAPPWNQLGYGPTSSFVFAQSQSVGWWIPIGLLIIAFAGWIGRTCKWLMSHFRESKEVSARVGAVADG